MNQQFCRCCLVEHPALTYNIFEDNIQAELMECIPNLIITPNDGLPEIICDLCWLRLREAVEFRRKCEKTDIALRKLHAEQSQLNETIIGLNEFEKYQQEMLSAINKKNNTLSEDEISMLADILLEDCDFSSSSCSSSEENHSYPEDNIITELLNKALSDPTLEHTGFYDTQPLTENKIIDSEKVEKTCKKSGKKKSKSKSLYTCNMCDKKFTRNFQLRLHMTSVHKIGDGLQYKCEECSKLFASRHSLTYHYKSMHSNERPYKCDKCDRRFILRSQLSSHMRIHTGDLKPRIHECTECGKFWPTKSDLRTHMRSHFPNMDRPFKCETCEKCFFTRGHLNSHMLVHTGVKPYICEFCQNSFQSIGNLNNHINRRHKKGLNNQKELFL